MKRRTAVLALVAALVSGPLVPSARGVAETIEPPPESPEGEDYEAEPADSLAEDQLEIGLSATGRHGERPRHLRRMRWSGDSVGGTLRDGDRDPLAGGSVEGRSRVGRFGIGRLAPRWGRGLMVGAPAEPWSLTPLDRGSRAAFRGRAGQGARFASGGRLPYEALYGRFGERSLGGLALGLGPMTVASLSGGGAIQSGVSIERDLLGLETVFDRVGRWRAEAALAHAAGGVALGARVRAGHVAFRSIAEPKRSGPAQALSVAAEARRSAIRGAAFGSLWRFRPGADGARAALEAGWRAGEATTLAVGFEEQHGLRRLPASASRSAGGFRQGWWGEWETAVSELRLAIRHEGWGAERLARQPVRAVTSSGVETMLFAGATLRITHTVYKVRRGESLYLPEPESDRLVLRALTGTGERTRIELTLPGAGGRLRAAVAMSRADGKSARAQWSLDWSRRGRWKRGR